MTLQHKEPDRVPWGEWQYDHDVVSYIIGRETFIGVKFRTTKAFWDGRRDEVIESYKRDEVDFIRGVGLDLVRSYLVPPKGYRPDPMKAVDHETYQDEEGRLHRVSTTTGRLMPYRDVEPTEPEPTLDDLTYEAPAPLHAEAGRFRLHSCARARRRARHEVGGVRGIGAGSELLHFGGWKPTRGSPGRGRTALRWSHGRRLR